MVEDHGETTRPLKADRLEISRTVTVLLLGAAAVGGILLPVVALLARHRDAVRVSQSLVERLALSSTVWVGSGRARRWPDSLHPGVDLRASPNIPALDTSPAGLLVPRPRPDHVAEYPTSRRPGQ